MAGANLPAKRYTKTAPTQLRMSFEFSGGTTQFIDIAKALSTLNRRFYRQGVYYYVNSIELYNNEDAYVDIHTLPDTWVTKNAWNRGFKIFQKMNAQADEVSNVGRPKYHDFKVYMSDLHRTTGSANPVTHGINSNYTTAGMTPTDWVYSTFTSMDDNHDLTADADEFNAHMIGPHVVQSGTGNQTRLDSVGLVISYGQTRHQPEFSNPVLPAEAPDDPLVNLFDSSSEEAMNDLIENLDEQNDATPYDHDYYIGESVNAMSHQARLVTTTSIGRTAIAPGFCAPMGLICVDPQATATAYRIVLNIAPGTYHGCYAERA